MSDPVWLADVLRAAGLRVIEHEGWRGRGHGDFRDIRGVLCHHTAGGGENDWRIVQYGRPDLDGPLAQLVLERDGTYRAIAAGVCWHAGRGSWPGWPTDNANYHVIGIEAVSRGDGSDWTPAQLDAYKRGCAAILRHLGRGADDCVAHREYSREGKIDPAGIDMDDFRADVQALIDRTAPATPDEETTMPSPKDIAEAVWSHRPTKPDGRTDATAGEMLTWTDLHAGVGVDQLGGDGSKDRRDGGANGWPQLGGRSLVDAVAVIGEHLGIEGFGDPKAGRK